MDNQQLSTILYSMYFILKGLKSMKLKYRFVIEDIPGEIWKPLYDTLGNVTNYLLSMNNFIRPTTDFYKLNPEIFKPIIFDGEVTKYQISNYGNVKNIKTGKIKKSVPDSNGRYHLELRINNKSITVYNHRLVANAFIPNLENKPTVNHIFGNDIGKAINTVWNLEWATQQEQIIHAYKTKLNSNKGINNPRCKINENISYTIGKMLLNGYTVPEIVKDTGYPRTLIDNIKYGRSWSNVKDILKINPELLKKHTSYGNNKKITDDDHHLIIKMANEGYSAKDILKSINNKITIKHLKKYIKEIHTENNSKSSTTIENDEYYTIYIQL